MIKNKEIQVQKEGQIMQIMLKNQINLAIKDAKRKSFILFKYFQKDPETYSFQIKRKEKLN